MTKPKPLPAIEKCDCKRRPVYCLVRPYPNLRQIVCDNEKCLARGPLRKTERGARLIWNKIMVRGV